MSEDEKGNDNDAPAETPEVQEDAGEPGGEDVQSAGESV